MSIKILARNVIKDFNLEYPLNLYKFCNDLNINIYREDIDMDGCLICHKGKTAIIVNSNNLNREKFSIAHELGHFFIPSHNELMFKCYDVGNSAVITKVENEREADEFASEILLPEALITKYTDDLTISKIIEAANVFETSLLSTAIRLIKLTEENAILIYLSKDKIKWHIWSDVGFMQLNTNFEFKGFVSKDKIRSTQIITNDEDIEYISSEVYKINNNDKLILIKEFCE